MLLSRSVFDLFECVQSVRKLFHRRWVRVFILDLFRQRLLDVAAQRTRRALGSVRKIGTTKDPSAFEGADRINELVYHNIPAYSSPR